MKLAVCFSGQPRYFDKWADYNSQLYKNCEIDYYAHFWGDDKVKTEIEETFSPKRFIVEPQVDVPVEFSYEVDTSKITKSVFVTLSPLYSMNQLSSIIENVNEEYDHWVLTRTDVVGQGSSLIDLNLDKDEIYTSYVPGEEWLTSHIDTRFICGTKEDILNMTKIYSNLDLYLKDDKIPLCHHRLVFWSVRHRKDKMNMIFLDPAQPHGGWYFIRNGRLEIT